MSNIILSFKELNKLKDTIYATEAAQTDHGFDYNRNARRVHIVYHVQTDDAHPEIVCKKVYFSAEDAAKALSER